MKCCRTSLWLCCCITWFWELQQMSHVEPSSHRARVARVHLLLLSRRTAGLKVTRAWLEEKKFYMFAINLWTKKNTFKHVWSRYFNALSSYLDVQSSILLLLYGCSCPEGRAESSTISWLRFLMCRSCPRGESKGFFQRGFRGVCWLLVFQADTCSQFPTCLS